jgi:transcriptional regulator with XRE-family HTH domain
VAEPPTSAQIGSAIRKLREERGLAIERLALAASMDVSYLSGIERGLRNPSWSKLRAIMKALDVEASELIRIAEELPPSRDQDAGDGGPDR